MKKLFSLLFLMIGSFSAWATSFTDNTAMNNHSDLSLSYLSQVFGTVGNVLHGTTGQMLGHLFLKLNEGIVIVAGLWLSYTIFTIVIRSAQEGSFMGANKNVALTFLKIAVGFSLLIPNPTTGYSLLQDIVMKVVVQGVGLADQTWEYGLDYVNNGGAVWHRPEASGSGKDIISDQTIRSVLGDVSSNKTGPGERIFANSVCMLSSQDNQALAQKNTDNTGPAINGSPPVQYDLITNEANHTFEFPGIGDSLPLGPGAHKCGSVSFDINNSCTGQGSGESKCLMAKQAVGELVSSLMPAAKKYYCSQHANADSCIGISMDNTAANNQETFFGAVANYVNIILPLVQMNMGGAETAKQFIGEAKNEGWLSAGRYYWDLSQVQSHYNQVANVDNYAPVNAAGPSLSGQPSKDASNALNESYGYIPSVLNIAHQYASSQNAGDAGDARLPEWNNTDGLVGKILFGITGDVIHLMQSFTSAEKGGTLGSDPIIFLHQIGMAALAVAGDIWFGFLGMITIALTALAACHAEFDLTPAVRSAVNWVKPLLMVLAGAFWAAGFILGFYVPMYPYLIYTFGIIGWLIAVIEAMVAAPLVCYGLTHPEGHDLLGEAKQALVLLLGIFLRPVLMVVGLIAAMILSYVSLRILIYTFSGFATDLFYVTAPSAGPASNSVIGAASWLTFHAGVNANSVTGTVMALLVFPMTFVIFTALVYVVTTQCFSLIYALPDKILRWIGGIEHVSHAAQMAQEAQLVGSAASTYGRGVEALSQRNTGRQDREEEAQRQAQVLQNHPPGGNDQPGGNNPGGNQP